MIVSHMPPTGDLTCNPGMCSDWELNQQPLGLQASTQSTEPHQPGLKSHLEVLEVRFMAIPPRTYLISSEVLGVRT